MSNFPNPKVSLIDLSKQLPFKIDNEVRKELCFGETLLISCGHYDPNYFEFEGDDSCSIPAEKVEVIEIPRNDYEVKNHKIEEPEENVDTEPETSSLNDFHFFFFPDCDKDSAPQNSDSSIIVVDGMPQINVDGKIKRECKCNKDKRGKCKCFKKSICECVKSHTNSDCSCIKKQQSCLCDSDEVQNICICENNNECICLNEIKTKCKCDKVSACVCDSKQVVFTHCDCTKDEGSDKSQAFLSIPIIRDDTATTNTKLCSCNSSSKRTGSDCPCATIICNCENPVDCKCNYCCECEKPCICDNLNEINKKENTDCQCMKNTENNKKLYDSNQKNKLKKVKVTKHGYRWCHEVDPRHTFFDFAYGRHDKILPQDDIIQKVKILHFRNDDKKVAEEQKAEVKLPKFKKYVDNASLDCCSVVGGITINVESLGEDKNKFLVQVVSHATKEGAKTGTKLVSIVDLNLHTLEENRTEHITKNNYTKEKRSYMAICDTGYYNKITRICGDRNIIKRLYHSYEDAHDFLLEGGNIILMRYFGLRRFKGAVKTKTVLIKGEICESIYVCQGVSQAIVNRKPLFVVKVERHIIEPNGFVQQTLTVLTLRGYIVSHEWSNQNYVIHLNPLLNIIPERDEIEPHEPLRERWREDMQLLSDYLDFKGKRTDEGGRYIAENTALVETIRNYLQILLLVKPGDALQFTRSYFGSVLSSLDLPHDEYFDNCSKHVRYFFFEE